MICPSCGGDYADWARTCPYCGSVNEAADEEAYMRHLEELRLRLDQVDDEAGDLYQKKSGHMVKWILILIGTVILVAGILVALGIYYMDKASARNEEMMINMQNWARENYGRLDQLYDEGKYDEILDEYYDHLTNKDDVNYYDWSHYYFVFDFYQRYKYLMEAIDQMEGREDKNAFNLGEGLYSALYLGKFANEGYIDQLIDAYDQNQIHGLSEDEAEIVKGYIPEALAYLTNTLNWSEAEIDAFYEKCYDGHTLKIQPCFDWADEYLEEKEN